MGMFVKGFEKNVIIDLKDDLLALAQDTSNLSLLLSLQFKLIKKTIRQECLIKRLKKRSSQLRAEKRKGGRDKSQSKEIKEKIKLIEMYLDNVRFNIYILKMFGDGIAFLYIDKFDVKHLYYNVVDYNPKELAGRLGGKEGLKEEWALVKDACKNDVPALLNDLTMSVRHGDVCLLGSSPPAIIEVKSSANKNNRVERQRKNIEQLSSFFHEDKAENFRNLPLVHRMEVCIPEVTYVDEMNLVLERCNEQGSSSHMVENGCFIIAIRQGKIEDELNKLSLKSKEILPIFLNEQKNNMDWSPLTPFTLSIKDSVDLYDFIIGDLTVLCIIDFLCYKEIAMNEGFELVLNLSGDYALIFKEFGSEVIWGVSRQVLLRVPLEMVSLAWIVKENIQRYRELVKDEGNMISESSPVHVPSMAFDEYRHLFLK